MSLVFVSFLVLFPLASFSSLLLSFIGEEEEEEEGDVKLP